MISGTVSDVFINVGKYVSPGTELAEMISHSKPGIILKAFEKDIYLLKPGMQIKAFSNENPDVIWDGKIVNILPQIREGGYAGVYAGFDKKTIPFIPGNFINADVELHNIQSIVVPEEAVVTFENKSYLFFVIRDKVYKMVEIQAGQADNGNVPVTVPQNYSSLPVVMKGAYTLLMALHNVEE